MKKSAFLATRRFPVWVLLMAGGSHIHPAPCSAMNSRVSRLPSPEESP